MPRHGDQSRAVLARGAPVEPTGAFPTSDVDGLLIAAGRGDLGAFATFYDRTAAAVFGLLRGVLGDDDVVARRATTQVYLHLWRNAAGFDPAARSAYALLLLTARRELTTRMSDLAVPTPAVVPRPRRADR